MYKGYTKEKVGDIIKIYTPEGVVCRTVTTAYLKSKTEKAIIEEILKRLLPQKPKKEFKTSVIDGKLHIEMPCYCPCCKWYLGDATNFFKYNACCNCGQVIEWES